MRSAKCVMKEGAHIIWKRPNTPFYKNSRPYISCGPPPPLRTTHFALRTEKQLATQMSQAVFHRAISQQ